jgi:DNA-binding CsgD family transcriptional regulator
MATRTPFGGGALTDRDAERELLDRFLEAVRAGSSRALVLRGEPGAGKSALLEYAVGREHGCRVLHIAGVQSEMELPYAGLRHVLTPILDEAGRLPPPQRTALLTAIGLGEGPPPDRFLVGLAVLTLLCEMVTERPLICVVDDEQWLDSASAQTLGFVARRLGADPVGLLFAARTPSAHLAGLPVLEVEGLRRDDARSLLDAALPGPLDDRVRELIVAEARGNPLALLELPRSMAAADLAGGFALPLAVPLTRRLEEGFARRLAHLPEPTQRLLQLAAADPSGDPALLRRAAERLGIPFRAAEAAVEAGLADVGVQLSFRHPLVRAAAYRSASAPLRREIHRALAQATDPAADPDRRAWHLAQAATGHDEDVAAELERSAQRAQARGGVAAASAFLRRAVELTADPGRRAERALAAVEATTAAGAFARARDLLDAADAGPLDAAPRARADLLRARLAFVSGLGGDAPALLLRAAEALAPLDPGLARETYLNAWMAASFAGRTVGPGSMDEVSRAAGALPPPEHPRPVDVLLDGLALLFTDGRPAAAPALRRAATRFAAGDVSREEGLRFGWMAAALVWDDEAAHTIQAREARLAREAGALDQLPIALVALAMSEAWRGEFATAARQIAEIEAICEITGSSIAPYAAMFLAALRGDAMALAPLLEASRAEAETGGQQAAATYAHWASAILANGRARHAEAFAAATRAVDDGHLYVSMWALPELVEAAARVGETDAARRGLAQLGESTTGGGDFGLGLQARCRALVGGPDAEESYREAVDRLGRAGMRPELARAHLLYGEWLHAAHRGAEALSELHTAHELLDGLGMSAFADRARQELLAVGGVPPQRITTPRSGATTDSTSATPLTDREALVAGLAADGLSNAEIGAQLYLSARTVEWHLRKVFVKLGVNSRRELRAVPPSRRRRERA